MKRCRCQNERIALGLSALVVLLVGSWSTADEFVLSNGGTIRGRWLNRSDRPLRSYRVETDRGVRLTLSAEQVSRVVYRPVAASEYERIAPSCPDTAEAQWELARWCGEHRLRAQREQHLRRVVQLDPEHAEAWHALGYSQVRGRWVRPDEALAERGYVQFQGRWRPPQEVELLKERQRVREAERRWLVDTRRWRAQLGSDAGADALARLRAIRDPHAIPAIARLLGEDRQRAVRLLCIEVLGQIDHRVSTELLVATAMQDQDEEIFHACLDELVRRKTPPLVKVFAQSLRDNDPRRVNRAGYALGQLRDDVAIEPLIDALVTTYVVARPDPSGKAPGATTFGIIRRNDAELGSYFAVRNGPQAIEIQRPNQGVLQGLEKLAGLSFGYDQRAWRDWYVRHRRHSAPPR